MNLSDNVKRDSAQVCRFVNDVLHRGRRRLIPVFSKKIRSERAILKDESGNDCTCMNTNEGLSQILCKVQTAIKQEQF